MKIKFTLLILFFCVSILNAQNKTIISVFPFQNKSDKQYEWLSYGLSYLINESMNNSGLIDGVAQEQIYKAVSDPEINFTSVLDGKTNNAFAKYQSSWNTNIFVIGSFTVNSDTLKIYARVCNLYKSNCSSPIMVHGTFQDFKGFYFLMTRLMESLYAEFISYEVHITRNGIVNSQDKTRQLSADYDGYKAYIKSWMALRCYEDGMISTGLNKFEDAIRFFETAQTLDESNTLGIGSNLSKVYLLRGNYFSTQSKWDEAIGDYLKSIQLNSMNNEAFFNLGNVYKTKKDYDNAITNYKKSIEVDAMNLEAYINIGYIYMEQGKNVDAMAAYDKALSINEPNAAAHYYAGTAYDNNGDPANAVKHYRRAIELDNTLAGAHLNLGIILKKQNDLAGARKEYESAVQFDPNSASAHRNLGILLMNDKNEAALAATHLQRCLELDPGQADAAIIKKNIGVLKKKSGKNKK